jgi:hypothetical protein
MNAIRDGQRSAVYAWENSLRKRWPEKDIQLTLEQCKELVNRVWRDYRPDVEAPTVHDGRGRRSAAGSRWRIMLPRWARCMLPVLHEIAHSLQTDPPMPGRVFTTLLLELWTHYADIPGGEARRLAVHQTPRRVWFAPFAAIPRRPPRAWQQWYRRKQELQRELRQHAAVEPRKTPAEPPVSVKY